MFIFGASFYRGSGSLARVTPLFHAVMGPCYDRGSTFRLKKVISMTAAP